MDEKEYAKIIKETYDEVINDFKTDEDKNTFNKIFIEILKALTSTKDETPKTTFDEITNEYLKSVKAISKLSPGLATGLYDIQNNIILNTYTGKMSDIPNDKDIDENTVFDSSSITKMFTAILLLKEEERGNIDLNKKFSDYSPLLKKIDIRIIDVLKFGGDLRTDGRLDDPNITKEERERRLKGTHIHEKNTFIYSDIPYMLVPLLYGNTLEEATENYIYKFYKLYRKELNLSNTGYSTTNMTGGIIKTDIKDNEFTYYKDELFDPKANLFEKEVGYISGHAGVTTTVKDLQKLFSALNNGLLNKKSLEKLISPIIPNEITLLDEEGKEILRKGKPVYINRGMGVYINIKKKRGSDVPTVYSNSAFTATGSTGTYSLFDLENGFNEIHLSNIRSGLYSKWIDTEDYTYGDDLDPIPTHYKTTLLSGTGTLKDGKLYRPDGTQMPYVRATNNFKEESLLTLLKLRIAKKALIKKAKIEYSGKELEEAIKQIEQAFIRKNDKRTKYKTKNHYSDLHFK